MNLIGGLAKGILLKGAFIPKLLNKPLLSCSLIIFDIVLSNTLHFYISIILVFCPYCVCTFTFCIFSTFQTI